MAGHRQIDFVAQLSSSRTPNRHGRCWLRELRATVKSRGYFIHHDVVSQMVHPHQPREGKGQRSSSGFPCARCVLYESGVR